MITTIITIIKIITILIIIIDAAADDDEDDIYSIVTLLFWFPFIIIYSYFQFNMIYHFRIMTQHCFTWGF